jgi:hypothetical protein
MRVKIFILIATAIFIQNIFSQKQLLASIAVHENVQGENLKLDSIAVVSNRSTISYKLILEYGVSTGIERYYYKGTNIEEMRTVGGRVGLSLTAINNIAFYDRFLFGIGGGIEYRTFMIAFPMELAGTCFLNFRYYFNKPDRLLIPMLNIAIGGRMTKEFDSIMANNPWHLSETMMYGVYSTFGAGFKIKLFSLQGGVLFWTKGNNLFGVDAMVKVGLNF